MARARREDSLPPFELMLSTSPGSAKCLLLEDSFSSPAEEFVCVGHRICERSFAIVGTALRLVKTVELVDRLLDLG